MKFTTINVRYKEGKFSTFGRKPLFGRKTVETLCRYLLFARKVAFNKHLLPTFRKKSSFQQTLATCFSGGKYLSTNTCYLLFGRKVPFNKHLLPVFRKKSTFQQLFGISTTVEKPFQRHYRPSASGQIA